MSEVTRYDAFRHIHYLLAADEHGSFRQAAYALSVRPSVISRRVRDMEDRLGVSLFIRSAGGVRSTVAGRQFLGEVRRTLGQLDDAIREAGTCGRAETGEVRIGLPFAPGDIWTSLIKTSWQGVALNGRILLVEAAAREILAALRRYDIDLAFVSGDQCPPGFRLQPLWQERLLVILPEEHRLLAKLDIHPSDLAGERCIFSDWPARSSLDQHIIARLVEGEVGPSIEYCSLQRENLLQAVALGQGLVVTTASLVRLLPAGMASRYLQVDSLAFSMVWSDRNDNPLARRLIAALLGRGRCYSSETER